MVGLIWVPYLLPLLTLLFQHLFPGSFEWPLQVCFTTCSGPAFARVVISVSGMSGDHLGLSPASRASQGPACAWTFPLSEGCVNWVMGAATSHDSRGSHSGDYDNWAHHLILCVWKYYGTTDMGSGKQSWKDEQEPCKDCLGILSALIQIRPFLQHSTETVYHSWNDCVAQNVWSLSSSPVE